MGLNACHKPLNCIPGTISVDSGEFEYNIPIWVGKHYSLSDAKPHCPGKDIITGIFGGKWTSEGFSRRPAGSFLNFKSDGEVTRATCNELGSTMEILAWQATTSEVF